MIRVSLTHSLAVVYSVWSGSKAYKLKRCDLVLFQALCLLEYYV